MAEADAIIRTLRLCPHPEGGHFRETFRDAKGHAARAHSTAIFYLLVRGDVSRWHRIDAAEVWHFYDGAPLELLIARAHGGPRRCILGSALAKKQRPQIVVPAGSWQAARTLGDFTLAGCTVAPGFQFERFELAPEGFDPLNPASAAPKEAIPVRGRSRARKRARQSRARD